MEISFASESLKAACLARSQTDLELPPEALGALRDIYNVMRNAENLDEAILVAPGPGVLEGGWDWRVDLDKGFRVALRINHKKIPLSAHGPDLSRIYRVQVMDIETPHG